MVLLIDTNIVIDVLANREEYYKDSSIIMKLCEANLMEGYISTLTFANIVYVMRKSLSSSKIENVLSELKSIFSFSDMTLEDLENAANNNWSDYEDAIQAAIASKIHANYIVTRNVKDFKLSSIPAITPNELILRFKEQYQGID